MAFDPVGVITTDYSKITDPAAMKLYVETRVANGSASVIFAPPFILLTEYGAGTVAANAIGTAVTNHAAIPSLANANIIKDKIALAVRWLDGLVALAVPIANAPANATTREEAATNITIIGFTPEKLTQSSHGTPGVAVFTATYVGNGVIDIEITNGAEFAPAAVIIVAVAVPPVTTPATPLPVITLNNGQILVTSEVSVPVISKTMTGKGQSANLTGMDSNPSWLITIYSMNGNKLISHLSVVVTVNLFTPPIV